MKNNNFVEILNTCKSLINDFEYQYEKIEKVIDYLNECFENKNKLLVCGNGGSAADAEHFVAELVCRFYKMRKGLPAISLTSNSSLTTAISNDFDYENIFSRQVESLGKKNDILVCISTSGKSKNVLNAIKIAKKIGIKTIAFTGLGGSPLELISDLTINVNSNDVPRIQEIHIIALHYIALEVEKFISKKS